MAEWTFGKEKAWTFGEPTIEKKSTIVEKKEIPFEPLGSHTPYPFPWTTPKVTYSEQEQLERAAIDGTLQEEKIPLSTRILEQVPGLAPILKLPGRDVPLDSNWAMREATLASEWFTYGAVGGPVVGKVFKAAGKVLKPVNKIISDSIIESIAWFGVRGWPAVKYGTQMLGKVLQGEFRAFSAGRAAQALVKKFGSEKKAMEYVKWELGRLQPETMKHSFMKKVQDSIFDTRWREAAYETSQILGDKVMANLLREEVARSTRQYSTALSSRIIDSVTPSMAKMTKGIFKIGKREQKEALEKVLGTSDDKAIQKLAKNINEMANLPDEIELVDRILVPEAEIAVNKYGIALKQAIKKDVTFLPPKTGEAPPQFPIDYKLPLVKDPRLDISLMRYFAPKKHTLDKAEELSKFPFYSQIYRPIMEKYNELLLWKRPLLDQTSRIFKNVSKESKTKITHYLEGKPVNLTEQELGVATYTREVYNKLFKEFNIDPERFLKEYSPRIRELKISFQEYIKKFTTAPKELKFFAELERTGELMPREEDSLRLLLGYIHGGGKKKFLAEPWKRASELLESGKQVPSQGGIAARHFLDDIYGLPAETTSALRAFQTNLLAKWNKLAKFDALIIKGVPADALINLHLTATYSGAMGFRPSTAIRNFCQTLLVTYPRMGGRWLSVGMKKALTPGGWEKARSLGILYDSYLPIPYGEEMGIAKGATWMLQKGLWGFRKMDSFNRVVAFESQYAKTMHFGEQFLKGKITATQFINRAEIDAFSRTVISKEVLPLLKTGKIEELATRLGKYMAEDTQWIYRKANSPDTMRGTAGKLFGQFGIWPANYLQYMTNLATKGTAFNRGRRIGRLLLMHSLIKETGEEVFGVDINRWTLFHPLAWGGSPAGGAVLAIRDFIVGSDYDKAQAKYQLKRVGLLHAPNFLMIEGLFKAADEIEEEDAVKRAMGFRPSRKIE